ncbi:hypothetical protein D3C76_1677160 [compost metagenome]
MIAMLEFYISKQFFNDPLAIIKVSFNRQVQHVSVVDGRHLQLLHFTYFAVGVQNADPNSFFAAYSFNS